MTKLLMAISILLITGACSANLKSEDDSRNDQATELGELVNFTEPEMDTVWPVFESEIKTIPKMIADSGMYNIDISKDNLHTHSEFMFNLTTLEGEIVMQFVSCSDYGYAKSWKKGQLFGVVDSIIDEEKNRYAARINEHRGADEFQLTPHDVVFNQKEIIIYTGDYKDHYKKMEE